MLRIDPGLHLATHQLLSLSTAGTHYQFATRESDRAGRKCFYALCLRICLELVSSFCLTYSHIVCCICTFIASSFQYSLLTWHENQQQLSSPSWTLFKYLLHFPPPVVWVALGAPKFPGTSTRNSLSQDLVWDGCRKLIYTAVSNLFNYFNNYSVIRSVQHM